MRTRFRVWAIVVCALLVAGPAAAQTINLAAGGADQVWFGPEANASAGTWLDQGAVGSGDSRRDLIIGAAGGTGVFGRVYVIFGGPVRSGNLNLNNADVEITGGFVGDRFGFSTAAGNIWNQDGASPRALLVGAPNAGAGNAGRVYLFRGGFSLGASLDTTDALLEIRGQPNDMLGYSLATADLNSDGYREMILGAPGNNRVYVIYGGPGLDHAGPTTVMSLGTTPANLTITGIGGAGANLAAGDITNDGIYDIAIGAPDANTVHIIKGRAGSTFPLTWTLGTTPADITIAGTTTGDRLGASMRILDFDNDNRNDLLIGAPSADGPNETRVDSGEVYLVLGPALVNLAATPNATLNAAQADIRFYGAGAGHLVGTGLTSGDINRDVPNDIVIHSPGSTAAGEWLVYYGRNKSVTGTLVDGIRIVDLGAAGQVDRRIVGDPARGQVLTAQVFEVTGEGARDIIVGVPASDAGAGAVFFTISPKLRLSSRSVNVNVVVNAGQSFAYPIRVTNSSTVPVTWAVTTNRPWITASTSTGSAVAGSDGTFFLVANGTGLAPGTYTGTMTVASTSRDLEMSLPIAVTMRVAPLVRDPGDFDGDGQFDVLWQHNTQGWISIWRMRGATLQSGEPLTPDRVTDTNWKIVGTGDFNGDGHPDLLWQHQTQGYIAVWTMNGTSQVGGTLLSVERVPDTNWKIVATGDFNADGRRDILWQHSDRSLAVWLMNGTQVLAGVSLTPSHIVSADWRIVGAGDFNADGKTDIVWQNSANGLLGVWYMNGTTLIDAVAVTPGSVPDTGWKIRAVGDLNADGKPDFLWQHTGNGALAAWFMNGVNQIGGTALTPSSVPDTAWRIVGPK